MSKTANRLGRGLNALVSPREAPPTPSSAPADSQSIRQLRIEHIRANPRQPRTTFLESAIQELADSIREHGLLQPILVRASGDNEYELVAGERRLRAARLAGIAAVPAIVRDFSDQQSFEAALVENLQREDLGPLERAGAYEHYLNSFGGSVDELGKRLGESRANISNYLRLLKLQPEVCYLLGSGELSMGQARAIASIEDPAVQLRIARIAVRRNLSVRQVEALARSASEPETEPVSAGPEPDSPHERHRRHVADALSKATGLRIQMYASRKKNTGRVVIHFTSVDEFDRISELLTGKADLLSE